MKKNKTKRNSFEYGYCNYENGIDQNRVNIYFVSDISKKFSSTIVYIGVNEYLCCDPIFVVFTFGIHGCVKNYTILLFKIENEANRFNKMWKWLYPYDTFIKK